MSHTLKYRLTFMEGVQPSMFSHIIMAIIFVLLIMGGVSSLAVSVPSVRVQKTARKTHLQGRLESLRSGQQSYAGAGVVNATLKDTVGKLPGFVVLPTNQVVFERR